MSCPTSPSRPQADLPVYARRASPAWVLLSVCLAALAMPLSFTGPAVALPALREALGGSPLALNWVTNAFMLSFGATLMAAGALADVYGRRRVFLAGLAVVVGSVLLQVCLQGKGAIIGFNLAPSVWNNFKVAPDTAIVTLVAVLLVAVLFKGLLGRLNILIGVIIGYAYACFRGQVDFSAIGKAAWVGLPEFRLPQVDFTILPMFIPVVLVLVAENVGHVKSVSQMTGRDYDDQIGTALFADGLGTTIAGFGGGSGTTTYGENIGVMAATKVYSTAAYWCAAAFALILSLCPKFGAVINTIPAGVLGGVITATVLAVFLVPLFFVMVGRVFDVGPRRRARHASQEGKEACHGPPRRKESHAELADRSKSREYRRSPPRSQRRPSPSVRRSLQTLTDGGHRRPPSMR